MENIINPRWTDINDIAYIIWDNDTIITMAGIWFIEREKSEFGMEKKIESLDKIIIDITNRLKMISYENKDNIITKLKEKRDLLSVLLNKFTKIKKTYYEYDNYLRYQVFEFYKSKYYSEPLFSFFKRRQYIAIMNEIQLMLKKKFADFCNDYVKIRDEFFDINAYAIKVKRFFNFQDETYK